MDYLFLIFYGSNRCFWKSLCDFLRCGKNTCKRIVDDDGEGKNQPGRTREVMNEIHTDVVKDTLDTLAPNRILNRRPPIVNPSP